MWRNRSCSKSTAESFQSKLKKAFCKKLFILHLKANSLCIQVHPFIHSMEASFFKKKGNYSKLTAPKWGEKIFTFAWLPFIHELFLVPSPEWFTYIHTIRQMKFFHLQTVCAHETQWFAGNECRHVRLGFISLHSKDFQAERGAEFQLRGT